LKGFIVPLWAYTTDIYYRSYIHYILIARYNYSTYIIHIYYIYGTPRYTLHICIISIYIYIYIRMLYCTRHCYRRFLNLCIYCMGFIFWVFFSPLDGRIGLIKLFSARTDIALVVTGPLIRRGHEKKVYKYILYIYYTYTVMAGGKAGMARKKPKIK